MTFNTEKKILKNTREELSPIFPVKETKMVFIYIKCIPLHILTKS